MMEFVNLSVREVHGKSDAVQADNNTDEFETVRLDTEECSICGSGVLLLVDVIRDTLRYERSGCRSPVDIFGDGGRGRPITDGGDWDPSPADLREEESRDASSHARRNLEQIKLAQEELSEEELAEIGIEEGDR